MHTSPTQLGLADTTPKYYTNVVENCVLNISTAKVSNKVKEFLSICRDQEGLT